MFTLNCKGRLLVLDKPIVMGILNITHDSFYSGSRTLIVNEALHKAEQMISEGATILDVGGQSTRPGSVEIGTTAEAERVLPVIEVIAKNFPAIYISVDTYHAVVAKQAVNSGACIVNDISGGSFDENMRTTIGNLKVPYICMHIKGTPQSMQNNPAYENATGEILDYFIKNIDACKQAGIHDIIIDVGFGFGKTIAHNFELLRNLSVFKIFEKPLLIGVSRKSTVYRTLGITPEEALNGTTVLHTLSILKGAVILRVHDVKEAVQAIKLLQLYSTV